jgi:WD40 repeat protein
MTTPRRWASLALLASLPLLACTPESDELVYGIQAHSFANSEWSAPENLGATINTPANEQGPTLSHDGLTLYFGSDRAGGSGIFDLWVARRACLDCPWEPPVNLGAVVNTAASETGPSLSIDGHLLFFTSARSGGQGGQDLYASHRSDPTTDLAWEPPVALGPGVNTVANEAGAEYLQSAEDGSANFYFNRAPVGGTADIFVAALTRDGATRGPAERVDELSDPAATDQGPSLRGDGREIFFFSPRLGTVGGNDLWVSTRRSVHDLWSAPVNLGAPINSIAAEQQPNLTSDGRTLLFASSRLGGFGGTDIWMVTRTPSGH